MFVAIFSWSHYILFSFIESAHTPLIMKGNYEVRVKDENITASNGKISLLFIFISCSYHIVLYIYDRKKISCNEDKKLFVNNKTSRGT